MHPNTIINNKKTTGAIINKVNMFFCLTGEENFHRIQLLRASVEADISYKRQKIKVDISTFIFKKSLEETHPPTHDGENKLKNISLYSTDLIATPKTTTPDDSEENYTRIPVRNSSASPQRLHY